MPAARWLAAAAVALAAALALPAPGLAERRLVTHRYLLCNNCGGHAREIALSARLDRMGPAYCARCARTAVNDVATGQAVVEQVRATMAGWGMRFPWGRIPLRFTTTAELARLGAGGHHATAPEAVCHGVVQRNRRTGARRLQSLEVVSHAGIPREVFGAVVAHELTHGWSLIQGRPIEQDPQLTEGGAELLAYYYLQTLGTANASYQKHRIFTQEDPVYGGGMRRLVPYAKRHRIRGVLGLLAKERGFPSGF